MIWLFISINSLSQHGDVPYHLKWIHVEIRKQQSNNLLTNHCSRINLVLDLPTDCTHEGSLSIYHNWPCLSNSSVSSVDTHKVRWFLYDGIKELSPLVFTRPSLSPQKPFTPVRHTSSRKPRTLTDSDNSILLLRFSVNFEMFRALIITTVWEITLGSSINFKSPHSHWMSNVMQFSEFHLSIL